MRAEGSWEDALPGLPELGEFNILNINWGVAIFPVVCRGSWMPGSKRFLDAHQQQKIFLRTNSCRKFLTTFFLVISKNFTKIFSPNSTCSFWTSSWMPRVVLHFLRIYPYFSTFTYEFFQKTPLLDALPHGCPGPSHPPHPSLHATVFSTCNMMTSINRP